MRPDRIGRSRGGSLAGGIGQPSRGGRSNLAPRVLARLRVVGLWPQLVGAHLAGRCRALDFDPGRQALTVLVSSERWSRELRAIEGVLIADLSARSGQTVKRIEFRIDPEAFEDSERAAPPSGSSSTAFLQSDAASTGSRASSAEPTKPTANLHAASTLQEDLAHLRDRYLAAGRKAGRGET